MRPEVFDVFKRVDHIVHGGDVGKPEILTELEALAPVTAVYGNVDGFELRSRLPQVGELELDGFTIVVTHGRSEEHTSELQSRLHLGCRLLLEKKKTHSITRVRRCDEST